MRTMLGCKVQLFLSMATPTCRHQGPARDSRENERNGGRPAHFTVICL